VFGGTKTQTLKDNVKDNAASATELATALARDKKFRKQLLSAAGHGLVARRRAAGRIGLVAAVARLANDPKLKGELHQMTKNLDKAWSRVQGKRSHKLRNSLLIVGGAGTVVAAAIPLRRKFASSGLPKGGLGDGTIPRTIEESIEVGVPVSTAYNQWTQFEDFPLFMEGVEHVQQLDDTRLHWVANVAGKTAEWDAKILEQHPDRQISWVSEDGKKTRGTVTFEPLGEGRTLVRLSMSYQAEGPAEALGSAAGLDARRVRGDLERLKELVESRGAETGGWRGEVSAGEKTS
jgi:uncharacterized membrane protein